MKEKKNKCVVGIKDKSIDEQQKQREKWRENSRACYRRRGRSRKTTLKVNVNENDHVMITDHNFENDTDPLELSCTAKSNSSLKNRREPKVTILSDVKVNFDLKKLFGSGRIASNWKYNVSSSDVGKDFEELKNK